MSRLCKMLAAFTILSIVFVGCSKKDCITKSVPPDEREKDKTDYYTVYVSKDSAMVSTDWQKHKYGPDVNAMISSGRGADTGVIANQPHAVWVGNSLATLARAIYGFDVFFADVPFLDRGFGGSMADGGNILWKDLTLNAKEKGIDSTGAKVTNAMCGQKFYYLGENHFFTRYEPGTWWKASRVYYMASKRWAEFYIFNMIEMWKHDLLVNPDMKITLISQVIAPKLIADKADIIAINAVLLKELKALTQNWSYIDIVSRFQNPDGSPLMRYFLGDQTHWTQAAYNEVVFPALKEDLRYKTIVVPLVVSSVVIDSVVTVTMHQIDSTKRLWHDVRNARLSATNGDSAMAHAKQSGKKINLFLGNKLPAVFPNLSGAFPNYTVFTRGVSGMNASNLNDYRDDLGVEYADNLIIYLGEDDYQNGATVINGELQCNSVFILQEHVQIQNAITYWKNKYPNLNVVFINTLVTPKLWRSSHGGNWQIEDFNVKKMQPFIDTRKTWLKSIANIPMKVWTPGKPTTFNINYFIPNSNDLTVAGYAKMAAMVTPFLVK